MAANEEFEPHFVCQRVAREVAVLAPLRESAVHPITNLSQLCSGEGALVTQYVTWLPIQHMLNGLPFHFRQVFLFFGPQYRQEMIESLRDAQAVHGGGGLHDAMGIAYIVVWVGVDAIDGRGPDQQRNDADQVFAHWNLPIQ